MSSHVPPTLPMRLLAPPHWPAWLAAGLLWLLARLPRPCRHAAGWLCGQFARRIPSRRRRIARRNLELCFPHLDTEQRRHLLDAHMHNLGRMLMETATGWFASDRAMARIPVRMEGLEHLHEARKHGQGVLLEGGHFTHLEMCSRLLSRHLEFRRAAPMHRMRIAGMYRHMDSPVFEWLVLCARLRYTDAMFDKDDLRGCVRFLRDGGLLWHAPDQDMRSKDNRFVPFFGISTATITATHHLARLGRARVIPFFHRRLPDGSYVLRLQPPLADFPGTDIEADTARISATIEAMVREAPEQYLWVHKRFKTRPPGEPSVYTDS